MKFEEMKPVYEKLFQNCTVNSSKKAVVDSTLDKILANRERYQAVQETSGVPWWVIGLIHSLEGSLNFKTHLHNGDPLTQQTVQVPKNRPPGTPPFTWEVSAADALQYEKMTEWHDWSIPGTLFVLEKYNGSGYQKRKMNSPYLWSFSNNYTKGKYGSDGKFDPNLVSKQCGAAVLMKTMSNRGISFDLPDGNGGAADDKFDWDEIGRLISQKAISVAGSKLFNGISKIQNFLLDADIVPAVLRPGFADGKWGKNTSDALKEFQKSKNIPETGVVDAALGTLMFTEKPEEDVLKILERGSAGEEVKNLQDNLIKLGYMQMEKIGNGYGNFGPMTENAVKAFQTHLTLPVSGKFGDAEQKSLALVLAGIGRDNPNTQIVKVIQNQFVKLTYLTPAQVTTGFGTFGPQTEAAVKSFQRDKTLPESGVVEAMTFDLLFNSVAAAHDTGDDFFIAENGEHYAVVKDILFTKSLQEKIRQVADLYFAATKSKLTITSGYRPPVRQAPAMFDKIRNEGEASVRSLYKNKSAVDEILKAYRAHKSDADAAVNAMREVIENQVKRKVYISSHLLSNAADVRMSANIKALKNAVIKVGGRIVVEANHYHLELH